MSELIVTDETKQMLAPETLEMIECMQDQLEVIDEFQVPKISAKDAFVVPGFDPVDEFEAIILGAKSERYYYKNRYNPKKLEPIACFSDGGKVPTSGTDRQADNCKKCPKNPISKDFDGSEIKCTHKKVLLLRVANSPVPMIIALPPTSISVANQYFNGLLFSGKTYWKRKTKFSLFKKDSSQQYYNIKLEDAGEVDNLQDLEAYRYIWRRYFEEAKNRTSDSKNQKQEQVEPPL